MFERMLDKACEPDEENIRETVGAKAMEQIEELETWLANNYRFSRTLRFPYGKNYGWGYDYRHGTKHLCDLFFESGAFTIMVQVGDSQKQRLEEAKGFFTKKTRELWDRRYPCGEWGGWIHYRVRTREELFQVMLLIAVKQAPGVKKRGS